MMFLQEKLMQLQEIVSPVAFRSRGAEDIIIWVFVKMAHNDFSLQDESVLVKYMTRGTEDNEGNKRLGEFGVLEEIIPGSSVKSLL